MNPIQEMRDRLTESFSGNRKPIKGLRPTANNMPRLPASSIPNPRARHDTVGRPAQKANIYKPPDIFRKKPRDVFGGWL